MSSAESKSSKENAGPKTVKMDFTPFAGKNMQFLQDFIHKAEPLDIMIQFKKDIKGIPFQCYTEKETKNDFEYVHLIVRLNLGPEWANDSAQGAKISLNHPSMIESELTTISMLKNAAVMISNYIPEVMHRNAKLIEKFLNKN